MPAPIADLDRGAVCLALYPFTPGFPLERVLREASGQIEAHLERFDSIEDFEVTIPPGDAPEIVMTVKLRRVLLLQDATSGRLKDATVLRVSSITDRHRSERSKWYRRLQEGTHPAAVLIGTETRHGTAGSEAYVNLLSISTIGRDAILRRTGLLSEDEMRSISERLVTTLELDISGLLERLRGPGSEVVPLEMTPPPQVMHDHLLGGDVGAVLATYWDDDPTDARAAMTAIVGRLPVRPHADNERPPQFAGRIRGTVQRRYLLPSAAAAEQLALAALDAAEDAGVSASAVVGEAGEIVGIAVTDDLAWFAETNNCPMCAMPRDRGDDLDDLFDALAVQDLPQRLPRKARRSKRRSGRRRKK